MSGVLSLNGTASSRPARHLFPADIISFFDGHKARLHHSISPDGKICTRSFGLHHTDQAWEGHEMRELSKKAKRRRAVVYLIENLVGAAALLISMFLVCGAAGLLCRLAGVSA